MRKNFMRNGFCFFVVRRLRMKFYAWVRVKVNSVTPSSLVTVIFSL